jgi:hypothetical protein
MLLAEHLWRAHWPAGDGPGSEDALTPRGAWLPFVPQPPGGPGVTAPPPPSPPAVGNAGASLLAGQMAEDLAKAAAASAAAPAEAAPTPDWRCDPNGNKDMLRVCGHMADVRGPCALAHAPLRCCVALPLAQLADAPAPAPGARR